MKLRDPRRSSGSAQKLTEPGGATPLHPQPRKYPVSPDGYELLEQCGRGITATVWKAAIIEDHHSITHNPHKNSNNIVAIKIIELECINTSIDDLMRESKLMKSLNHPNLIPLHCCFVHQEKLWLVMPFIDEGSLLNIMKLKFPDGFNEEVIATILKDVLLALDYLHKHDIIHRDIKADNILVDKEGHIWLADIGVSAELERRGSFGNSVLGRTTFVGTLCWMAPEVMQQIEGVSYDSKADIWSVGITLLELCHGRPPMLDHPPPNIVMNTLQGPSPAAALESSLMLGNNSKKFSKALVDFAHLCLLKDPTKRPTAAQLLEHKFFRVAKSHTYLVRKVLKRLPPVEKRHQNMQERNNLVHHQRQKGSHG